MVSNLNRVEQQQQQSSVTVLVSGPAQTRLSNLFRGSEGWCLLHTRDTNPGRQGSTGTGRGSKRDTRLEIAGACGGRGSYRLSVGSFRAARSDAHFTDLAHSTYLLFPSCSWLPDKQSNLEWPFIPPTACPLRPIHTLPWLLHQCMLG